jgi:hypothetical protein
MLGLCWAYEVCWTMLGPCWVYVEACWPFCGHVGLCWAYVVPILGPCWAHVRLMLGHVETKFGNFADFTSVKTNYKKHRILEQ